MPKPRTGIRQTTSSPYDNLPTMPPVRTERQKTDLTKEEKEEIDRLGKEFGEATEKFRNSHGSEEEQAADRESFQSASRAFNTAWKRIYRGGGMRRISKKSKKQSKKSRKSYRKRG